MAGGRRSPAFHEHGQYDGGKVARRSRTSSSERRARLSPGWMRQKLATEGGMNRSYSSTAVHSDFGSPVEDAASPEGCMRWKPPEDSPEASTTGTILRVRSTSARGSPRSSRAEEVGSQHFAWPQRQAGSSSQRPRNRRSTGDLVAHGTSGGAQTSQPYRGYRPGPEMQMPPVSHSARSERSSCSDSRATPRPVHTGGRNTTSRPGSLARVGFQEAEDVQSDAVGENEREPLENQIKTLSERLAAAERERNWALVALRESESALQASLNDQSDLRQQIQTNARQEKQRAEVCSSRDDTDLHLRHYRVMVELLDGRCHKLELRLEDEVQAAASREEDNRRTIALLEEQTVRLGLAMVEQQRAFKIRAEELRVEQEGFMQSHRRQLEDARRQAHSEVVSLREDYKQREEMWAQDLERLAMCGQGCEEWSSTDVNGKLGDLLLEPASDMVLASIPEVPDSPDEADASGSLGPAQRLQPHERGIPCQEGTPSVSSGRSSQRGSPQEVGLPEGDLAWPGAAASERVHLADSWDVAATLGVGPGLSSATGVAASGVASSTACVADAMATNGESHPASADGEKQWLLQSLSGFLSTGLAHPSSPEDTQAPASPQFGKWPVDEAAAPRRRAAALSSRSGGGPPGAGSATGSGSRGKQRAAGALQDSATETGGHCQVLSRPQVERGAGRGHANSSAASSDDFDRKGSEDLERGGDEDVEELLSSLEGMKDPRRAARIWARIGTVQQRRKCFVEARAAYSAAVQLDSSQHGCLANLSQLEAHASNLALARKLLAQALEIDPNNTAYHAFKQWLQSASPTPQPAPNA